MRYDKLIIEKAKSLRREGKTYGEIRLILGRPIPKSTLSCWCAREALPDWFSSKLEDLNSRGLRRAQQRARSVFQKQREERQAEAVRRATNACPNTVDVRVKKLLLAMLHLGEGTKSYAHSGLVLGSADEQIIRLYLALLRDCYQIQPTSLRCRVSYRADQDIEALQAYWSHVTLIPLNNFYQTKPDPRTIGVPTKNQEYKGVCVIFCPGTRLEQLELEALAGLVVQAVA